MSRHIYPQKQTATPTQPGERQRGASRKRENSYKKGICLQTASQEAAQRAPIANQPKSTRRHQKTTENIDKEPSKKLKNSKK